MRHAAIRSKLKQFLGPDRFQKFVVDLRKLKRLRFWQEAMWHEFLKANPECEITEGQLQSVLRVCEIHGDELQLGAVSLFQGNINQVREFVRAQKHQFPHDGAVAMVQHELPVELLLGKAWYCAACCVARDAWKIASQSKLPTPDLCARYYPISGIPADHLQEALKLVAHSDEVPEKRVMSTRLHPEGYLEIKTGVLEGELWGGGNVVILRRHHSSWVIAEVGSWSS